MDLDDNYCLVGLPDGGQRVADGIRVNFLFWL